jgi:hypothetical protein
MPNWKKVITSGSDASLNTLTVVNGITGSLLGTASYALTAGNGGVTKIIAGANINLSPVSGLGDVTVTAFGTNLYNTATGSYGSFYDTGSVLATSATAIYSMSLSTTDISNGVFVSASNGDVTRVKFTNAGTYNIQFSSQFSNTDNSNQDVVVWLRKNGTDIPDSSGTVGVPPFKAGSNGQAIASWNYYVPIAANDFIQLCWHSEQANVITLETIAAGTSPTHPRTPSTILTATRVDTFLSNTGSFSGSFTGILTGTASYASQALSSSFATTASYILQAVSASYAPDTTFPYTGSAIISGSLRVTGSIESTGAITSSILNPTNITNNYIPIKSGSALVDSMLYQSVAGETLNWGSNTTPNARVFAISAANYPQVKLTNAVNNYSFSLGPAGGFQFTNGANNNVVIALAQNASASISIVDQNILTCFNGGNFAIGHNNIYTIPSKFYVVGNSIMTGSLTVSGSVMVTGGITGSLLGTASYASQALSASYALTSSYVLNAVSASFASTASYVNTLNQNVLITGSLTIGSSSLGASENTLTLGPSLAGGAGEGGQLGLNAAGGSYTSASMLDNYQNRLRILKGTNAGSDSELASWNLVTKQMTLPAYTNASSFVGTATANLAVDSGGNIITVSTTGGSVFPYTGNAVITGSLTTTGIIYAQPNGGMYFQGGDDAALYDINVVNTMGVYGVQDVTVGAVKLGSNGPVLYGSGSKLGIGTINPSSASLTVNGNVWATSFTGSLLGTASYASQALSSSFATTASYVLNAVSSSFASTASYWSGSIVNAASASFASTASYVVTAQTASYVILAQTASYVVTAQTASFVTGSIFTNGNRALSASYALTSSYVLQAVSASFATTASYASTYAPVFPYTGSAIITGSLIVTGSTSIKQSNGTISGSSLTVYGSGSSLPVFTVQGSQGELFSVTDSLSGSLFSVNDISGLPVIEAFSDNTVLLGSYQAPALLTTYKTVLTASGNFTLSSLPTASYDGAFYDYTARSGSNARAGSMMAIWSGSSVNFTETTTTDFGSTTGLNLGVFVIGGNMVLTGSASTTAWTIKTIIRSI